MLGTYHYLAVIKELFGGYNFVSALGSSALTLTPLPPRQLPSGCLPLALTTRKSAQETGSLRERRMISSHPVSGTEKGHTTHPQNARITLSCTGKRAGFAAWETRVQILALPFTSCGVLVKSLQWSILWKRVIITPTIAVGFEDNLYTNT